MAGANSNPHFIDDHAGIIRMDVVEQEGDQADLVCSSAIDPHPIDCIEF